MKLTKQNGLGIIILTIIIALALSMLPLPDILHLVRPEWAAMALIYWCMALPHRVGVGVGWTVGLLLDVARDSLLGEHALAFALIAFIILQMHQRMRVFPVWHQAAWVAVMILLEHVLLFWIKGITGTAPDFWSILLPALSTLLFWPPVYLVLRHLRRQYQVS